MDKLPLGRRVAITVGVHVFIISGMLCLGIIAAQIFAALSQ